MDIKAWQDYLKTSPMGVLYTGPLDGVFNDSMQASLEDLQARLNRSGNPIKIIESRNIIADVEAVKKSIEQPKEVKADVLKWKAFLKRIGMYSGDTFSSEEDDLFKSAMQALEKSITDSVPSVKGMIWQNGKINPSADIADVEEALSLLKKKANYQGLRKVSVTNFDELGSPTASDYLDPITNAMFISRDDSQINEVHPGNNQNQGAFQGDVPIDVEEPVELPKSEDIDDRMQMLVQLMDSLEI